MFINVYMYKYYVIFVHIIWFTSGSKQDTKLSEIFYNMVKFIVTNVFMLKRSAYEISNSIIEVINIFEIFSFQKVPSSFIISYGILTTLGTN